MLVPGTIPLIWKTVDGVEVTAVVLMMIFARLAHTGTSNTASVGLAVRAAEVKPDTSDLVAIDGSITGSAYLCLLPVEDCGHLDPQALGVVSGTPLVEGRIPQHMVGRGFGDPSFAEEVGHFYDVHGAVPNSLVV